VKEMNKDRWKYALAVRDAVIASPGADPEAFFVAGGNVCKCSIWRLS
jgi:hypothetical protein